MNTTSERAVTVATIDALTGKFASDTRTSSVPFVS